MGWMLIPFAASLFSGWLFTVTAIEQQTFPADDIMEDISIKQERMEEI